MIWCRQVRKPRMVPSQSPWQHEPLETPYAHHSSGVRFMGPEDKLTLNLFGPSLNHMKLSGGGGYELASGWLQMPGTPSRNNSWRSGRVTARCPSLEVTSVTTWFLLARFHCFITNNHSTVYLPPLLFYFIGIAVGV